MLSEANGVDVLLFAFARGELDTSTSRMNAISDTWIAAFRSFGLQIVMWLASIGIPTSPGIWASELIGETIITPGHNRPPNHHGGLTGWFSMKDARLEAKLCAQLQEILV